MLRNNKGISVLFLIIALLLLTAVGYVLSYLIPTKQKSVIFPIHSAQSFYLAQAGIEYAIRFSSDQGWRTGADLVRLNNPGINQRSLGRGRFTILYDPAADRLTSTGEITDSDARRTVRVDNFTPFLRLIFYPPHRVDVGTGEHGGRPFLSKMCAGKCNPDRFFRLLDPRTSREANTEDGYGRGSKICRELSQWKAAGQFQSGRGPADPSPQRNHSGGRRVEQ